MDDDSLLWLVGAVAFMVVVAAFVWVLRHRDDAALPEHHSYEAPEITLTGRPGQSGITFGSDEPGSDEAIDQTIPLSFLGGAGRRDAGGFPTDTTTDSYAGASPSLPEEPSVVADDSPRDHHVAVDDTGPRPVEADDLDRRRGGHW